VQLQHIGLMKSTDILRLWLLRE